MKRDPEVRRDPANPATFPPVVSPPVNPAAARYGRGAQARHPNQYAVPVAGGVTPPIPRLDAQAAEGLSMSDQANLQRAPEGLGPTAPLPGIFQGAEAPMGQGPLPVAQQIRSQALLPDDILPEEAKTDPDFRQGGGSMYALSQPHMAYKYGVIRKGRKIPPQQLGTPPKGLSKDTIEGLRAVGAVQQARAQVEAPPSDRTVAERAAAGTAAAAAGQAGTPGEGPETVAATKSARVQEAIKNLDDFDFNTLREMMMKDLLNNEEQRRIIEARLTPLDITDLILKKHVLQKVPIIPGKFEPTFQSMSSSEDLALKRLILEEGNKIVGVNDRYLLDKFAAMGVALGTYAINNNALPSYQDEHGRFNEEKFWAKFELLTSYPMHMISSLGVNYYWFDIRVRSLFAADAIKNG